MFNATYPGSGSDYVDLKTIFAGYNEGEDMHCCPLSNCNNPYGGLDDGMSDCCEIHDGVGCDESECEDVVCAIAPECCGLCLAGDVGASCSVDTDCDVAGDCGTSGLCLAGDIGATCASDAECDVPGDCSSWDSACAALGETECCDYICENNEDPGFVVGEIKAGLGEVLGRGARENGTIGSNAESASGAGSSCGAVGLVPLVVAVGALLRVRLVRGRRG
jgi:hypothetical protein